LKFHALAARSFRAPTFNDLYWPTEDWGIWGGVEGNQNLSPEKAESYEMGISGYFLDMFKTDLTFFRTNFDDLIEWSVDNSSWWRPENVSSAKITGLEFETEFVLREHLKANLSYSCIDTKNKNTDKWLIYRPRHLYKSRLIYSPTPQCEFSVNGIYKTKRYANAANTSVLEHYFVIDTQFSYKLTDYATVLLEAKNILDRHYQEERDYPMPGRAIYGGITVSF
ncbi:MAG: TonB-dependent receptor, partial [Candidatus Omnitrophica bacterium]|nr:TonB-dependent receptor [Candidatus Omnitrophota bacterium]